MLGLVLARVQVIHTYQRGMYYYVGGSVFVYVYTASHSRRKCGIPSRATTSAGQRVSLEMMRELEKTGRDAVSDEMRKKETASGNACPNHSRLKFCSSSSIFQVKTMAMFSGSHLDT